MEVGRRILLLNGYARGVVLEAAAALVATRLGLRIIGLRRWRAVLASLAPTTANADDPNRLATAREISRLAAATARRLFFRPTCLEESLVLWWMLRRHGIAAELRLGARKESNRFEAHAWVELDGAALNDSAAEYVHFVSFEGPASSVEVQAR